MAYGRAADFLLGGGLIFTVFSARKPIELSVGSVRENRTINKLELYRLKSFAAIAREKNLTRAAARLHISQSALSSQLKQLEEDLGLALFVRTPRGMALSEAGAELFPLIEGVLDAADKLRLKALSLQQSGGEAVNIGLNTDPAFLRVGAINRRLALLHPELNVVFLTSQTAQSAHLLRQGHVDLAFFYGDAVDPDLRHRRLAEVRLCTVVPAPLAKAGISLDWEQVARLPWVWVDRDSPPYAAMLEEFERRRLVPNKAVRAVDEYIVKELVVDGQGVAVMREDEARPLAAEGRVILWEKGWLSLPLSIAWRAANGERKRLRAARETIEHVWSRPLRVEDEGLARFCY
jgi:DNA-binding transcriptional LysR family regulator